MTQPDATGEASSVVALRAAMAALPDVAEEHAENAEHADPSADAERFDAVHEALVAVLADVDRT